MKLVKGIFNSFVTAFIILFVIVAGISFFSAPDGPGLFGYKGYTVVSGSMEPELSVGDFIFVELEPFESVSENDVITFTTDQEVVTHRVAERTDEGLVTRGDANTINDQTGTTEENYIGKLLFAVPYFGYFVTFLQEPLAFSVIIALIGLYLIYYYYFLPSNGKKADQDEPEIRNRRG